MRVTSVKYMLLFCAATLPSVTMAQTYVGASGGISLKNKSQNKGVTTATIPATTTPQVLAAVPSGTSLGWRTQFDRGLNANAFVGHRFPGGVRVEGQISYTKNGVKRHSGLALGGTNIDALDASVLTRGAPIGSTVGTVLDSGIGKTRSLGFYANGYFDINAGGNFQPYVGAGAGVSRNKVDFRPSNINVGRDSKTKFSYQVMAGATAKVSDRFELFGQYTYRDAGRTKIALDLLPADLSVSGKQSIISAGVRIPLGASSSDK